MKHRIIISLVGLGVVLASVAGGMYLKWSTESGVIPQLVPGPPAAEPAVPQSNSATLWLGLKNSDDQGTNFDLRVELYKNATLVAAGETRCVTGITRNPDKAKEVTVSLDPVAEGPAGAGEFSFKALTRIGTNPNGTKCAGHSNATGLRLYYDVTNRPSRINTTNTPASLMDYFLRTDSVDFAAPIAPSEPPSGSFKGKYKDSSGVMFSAGNVWQAIGSWNVWGSAVTLSGAKLIYPSDWTIQTGDRGSAVTTLSDPALLDEDTVRDFAFFNVRTVRPRPGTPSGSANPGALPIDVWFDQYSSNGFSAEPTIAIVQVAGRSAIRLEMAEAFGEYAHIYVPDGYDVIEISFPLYDRFTSTYETILNALTF